ncbi:L-threonylcarbamoyladenylate synthase [Nocardia farcinica]|uniref:L-threonylcarbamoyladenylate synthase n=1 Tax=Nocardia farcinica TaxID=37329 RepID=UPI00189450ED|nr:L-threonylcarbamoyladenylate synthase [Nocardia farcinica]MBF6259880.1 L-threonylcarbamoyladenylate synthase [Nocardia farcinica]
MKIIEPTQLDVAVDAVAAGQLVIVPTHRWYMICADARDAVACDRIYEGKRRPATKPLALVVRSQSEAADLFVFSDDAHRLAAAFWPGDLALILPWRDTENGKRHAAVGSPNALVVNETGLLGELAACSPVPIAATSANISGAPGTVDGPGPSITLAEVQEFVDRSSIEIAACVDGGICPTADHLTVIDCTGARAVITRPGLVHERAIVAALRDGLDLGQR